MAVVCALDARALLWKTINPCYSFLFLFNDFTPNREKKPNKQGWSGFDSMLEPSWLALNAFLKYWQEAVDSGCLCDVRLAENKTVYKMASHSLISVIRTYCTPTNHNIKIQYKYSASTRGTDDCCLLTGKIFDLAHGLDNILLCARSQCCGWHPRETPTQEDWNDTRMHQVWHDNFVFKKHKL